VQTAIAGVIAGQDVDRQTASVCVGAGAVVMPSAE